MLITIIGAALKKAQSFRPNPKGRVISTPAVTLEIERAGLAQGWLDFLGVLSGRVQSDVGSVTAALNHVFRDYVLVRTVFGLPSEARHKIAEALLSFLNICTQHKRCGHVVSYYVHFTRLLLSSAVSKDQFTRYLRYIYRNKYRLSFADMGRLHQSMASGLFFVGPSKFSQAYAEFVSRWFIEDDVNTKTISNVLRSMRTARLYHAFKYVHAAMTAHTFHSFQQVDVREKKCTKFMVFMEAVVNCGIYHKELPLELYQQFYEFVRNNRLPIGLAVSTNMTLRADIAKICGLILSYMGLVVSHLVKDYQQKGSAIIQDKYLKTCITTIANLHVLALCTANYRDIDTHVTAMLTGTVDGATSAHRDSICRLNRGVFLRETSAIYQDVQSSWLGCRVQAVWGCLYAQVVRSAFDVLLVGDYQIASLNRFAELDQLRSVLINEYAQYIMSVDCWKGYFYGYVEQRIPHYQAQLGVNKPSCGRESRHALLPVVSDFMQHVSSDIAQLIGAAEPFVLRLRYVGFFDLLEWSYRALKDDGMTLLGEDGISKSPFLLESDSLSVSQSTHYEAPGLFGLFSSSHRQSYSLWPSHRRESPEPIVSNGFFHHDRHDAAHIHYDVNGKR
jgi:hypothetical protein